MEGIADFVGVPITKTKAKEIAQACSFNNMKKSEQGETPGVPAARSATCGAIGV